MTRIFPLNSLKPRASDQSPIATDSTSPAEVIPSTYLGYEGETLDNFVASIERYNQLCEIGLDEDFGKEKQLMIGVTQPPYYAYAGEKTIGHMLCNGSGIAIDENGQVLSRADYRPIPGLFAAGNTAGSRFGIQYTTALCGASISFAVTQGKFTGEYVASLV